jgi:hypothetical protein
MSGVTYHSVSGIGHRHFEADMLAWASSVLETMPLGNGMLTNGHCRIVKPSICNLLCDIAGISQEVEGLLVQLRVIRLDADSWRSATVLLSQLGCCVHYCMACTAGTCWSMITQELDSESNPKV